MSFWTVGVEKHWVQKDHIYFIPNAYSFLQNGKINNNNNIYILYIEKIFEIIEYLIKSNIYTITIDLFNLELLKLVTVEEIESLFRNQKFWTFFKNSIYHKGIQVNFLVNNSLFNEKTTSILRNLEKKVSTVGSNFTVNFLIGYDIFEQLKISF